jgi:hypothetical protein
MDSIWVDRWCGGETVDAGTRSWRNDRDDSPWYRGALVGGFIGRAFGWYDEGDPVGFIMAVIGAILVLFAYRKISGSVGA